MTASTFQTLFLSLGINFDKPDNATILNSAAYKALALKLDLWSRANQDVLEAFCLHFEYLLVTSRHKRFNILKCFKKVAIVRAFMFALKANTFDSTAIPTIIRELSLGDYRRGVNELTCLGQVRSKQYSRSTGLQKTRKLSFKWSLVNITVEFPLSQYKTSLRLPGLGALSMWVRLCC